MIAAESIPMIGPATEARLQMAFAETCLLTCQSTARLLGLDEKSLRALTDGGIIRAVRRGGGRTRAYTEGDIRAYLTQGSGPDRAEPKPRASQPVPKKVVSFTEMRRAKRQV